MAGPQGGGGKPPWINSERQQGIEPRDGDVWISVPVKSGAMMRKGKTGAAHEDGMTPAISAELRAFGSRILPDPAALKWLYEGGPLA